MAIQLTEACQPIGTTEARAIGFIDDAFGTDLATFEREVEARAAALARRADYASLLAWKQDLQRADEARKPLADYRAEELTHMWDNFFGPGSEYHAARQRFVHKTAGPAAAPRREVPQRRAA
jgi:putative two-component system hydrogenase maturation factor HypX/HoxX